MGKGLQGVCLGADLEAEERAGGGAWGRPGWEEEPQINADERRSEEEMNG